MPQQIEKVIIKNFKNLENIEQDVNGRNVFVIGKNGHGKSSFLQAIWTACTGNDLPTRPIKDDGEKGLIEVKLTDFTARLKFTKNKKPTFELERNADSKKITAPRTFLNDIIKIIDFDIDKFIHQSATEKVKYLSKIIGINFNKIDSEIDEIDSARKLEAKELERLKNSFEYYDKELAEAKPVDIVAVSKQIAAEVETRSDRFSCQKGIESAQKKILEYETEIKRLQVLINKERGYVFDGLDWLKDVDNAAMPDADFDKLQNQLETANSKNKQIEDAREMKKIEEEIAVYNESVSKSNSKIQILRGDKGKQLKQYLDIENLEYDTELDAFTWKGLPFEREQINTADIIIAGLQIGATMLGDLRIMKFDGSLIDDDNMKLVKEFAAKQKIELFVECVDRSADCLEIIVE